MTHLGHTHSKTNKKTTRYLFTFNSNYENSNQIRSSKELRSLKNSQHLELIFKKEVSKMNTSLTCIILVVLLNYHQKITLHARSCVTSNSMLST